MRRWFPVTARFHGEHFMVRAGTRASHESEQPGTAALADEMVDRAKAGMVDKFRYLKVSLSLVLLVVGVKMLTAKWLKAAIGEHFNFYLLALVFLILTAGVVASLLADRREGPRATIDPHKL
ncbi:MAG: hypothetical protein JW955_18815 [Sedimentisphaerales bacterium]|nr:hypothetical protein [Sedimentisphaerales bacterium]